MNSIRIHLGLLLAVLALGSNAAEKPENKPEASATTTTNVPTVQVTAYYFHGTVRCETCQKIERQAREVIEQKFKPELVAKQLVFKPLNYDLPENAHFQPDYKLPCPSLVLVRSKAGKDEKWKLLGDTWELVEDTTKFNRYIETEVAKFVRNSK